MGDILKLILKFSFLFIIGLSIAIIIYPFLHEVGHSVSAFIFGAEVVDFKVLPVPLVRLKMNFNINEFDMCTIGFSGVIFPFFITFLLPSESFWKWYIKIVLRLICLISFLFSLISVLAYQNGTPLVNDDFVTILNSFPQSIFFCYVLLLMLLFVSVIIFTRDFIVFNKKQLYKSF